LRLGFRWHAGKRPNDSGVQQKKIALPQAGGETHPMEKTADSTDWPPKDHFGLHASARAARKEKSAAGWAGIAPRLVEGALIPSPKIHHFAPEL